MVNPEESMIMSCDMEVQVRKFENIKKGEQPIRPRRSLALRLDNCTLSPLARTRYSSPRLSSDATSSATPVTLVIRPSMEDIDEGIEEGSEGEHNVEGNGSSWSDLEVVGVTPGIGLSQGRKRTRVAIKGALSSKTSAKQARAATTPLSLPLKAKNALNKHFYTKTVELRIKLGIVRFDGVAAGMGYVELALFAEQYNENLVKELYANMTEEFGNPESPAYGQLPTTNVTLFLRKELICSMSLPLGKRSISALFIFKNILRQIDQMKASKIALPCPYLISEYLLGSRDLSLPSDSYVRALDPGDAKEYSS
ncbi:hypothetical protein M9H77_17870 [Catharanthus roseus]|uniref:Uncharacterized protein n=1 Tax=Catharanthus roseus TaxID=4058 RepID=A0ACC0B628_CATRO|nr:hypothetical protein M9H77_17870 [Catharanthus roseus]